MTTSAVRTDDHKLLQESTLTARQPRYTYNFTDAAASERRISQPYGIYRIRIRFFL